MDDINTRLAAIQQQLKTPKDKYNEYRDFYYRNAASILAAIKPLLEPDESIRCWAEPVRVGEWNYVVVHSEFWKGDKCISARGAAREPESRKGMDASQITGAANTYAKKYSLENLCGIDDSSGDPDTTNKHGADGAEDAAGGPETVNSTLITHATKMAAMRDPAAVSAYYNGEASKRNKSKDWYKGELGQFHDALVKLLEMQVPDGIREHYNSFKSVLPLDLQELLKDACAAHAQRLKAGEGAEP